MRIYDSRGDTHDFCSRHFPGASLARDRFADKGEGPDGRGNCYAYDEDHPDYEADDERCETCGCRLRHPHDYHGRRR